ncbi:MAG: DNA-binding protein [Clostridia bacterium]|nr:DNA-binding protein [Clostridia bacterium]
MKEKDFSLCLLYDIYSPLMTEKKRSAFELSFFEDMSLSEIAEHTGTTRQGVRELIKRTCEELYEYEQKLHLKELRDKLSSLADEVEDEALSEKIRNIL